METAIITSKGQILIPKRIRTKYGIVSGFKVAFIETSEGVLLKPMDEKYINEILERAGEYFPGSNEYSQWKQEEKDIENRFLNEPVQTYKKRKGKPKSK